MDNLSALERAVLDAIALQLPDLAESLAHQQQLARVTARANTGAGFYTTFDVSAGPLVEGVSSPVGNVSATIHGLEHGMGFLLWLKDGKMHQLEGYSFGESTLDLDLKHVHFEAVGPRI
jgi:hypothetical protein